jgi:hypothetical protein
MDVVMPAAPIPPPFEHLEGRRFSLYPPIRNITSNEWTYRHATWSEIVIRHTATKRDLWIPRRFLGEASRLDSPVVVIGLNEQLEFRDGAVWPIRRRVLEMPIAVGENPRPRPEQPHLAPVIGIRLEPRTESRASRLVGGAVALGVLGCLAIVGYSLEGSDAHRRALVTSLDHTYLALSSADSYRSVLQVLGTPDSDRWVTTAEGNRMRLLDYPDRGFRAVLIADPAEHDGRYVGSIDEHGRILQSVLLPEGKTSSRILHGLEDF